MGHIDPASSQEDKTLTIRQGVDPVLVEAQRDAVHLCLALGLLHLPPLLGQSALHHGGLGQRAVRVLEQTGRRRKDESLVITESHVWINTGTVSFSNHPQCLRRQYGLEYTAG